MLNLSIGDRKARFRLAEPEAAMPAINLSAISLIESIALRERLGHPGRLAAQSLLLMAGIVVVTFALLVLLDYAGIHITPTGDMLAAD